MPNRFQPPEESRWSSERERLERERMHKEFEAKRPTPPRRSSWREGARQEAGDPEAESSPIRERREPETSDTDGIRPATVGRRWRDSVTPPPDDGGSSLPPLPGDDGGSSRGGASGKGLLIFGALLFLLMAVLAFLPFGPLGGGGDDADPTAPAIVVPTSPAEDPAAQGDISTPPPRETLADARYTVCIDPGHGGWDLGWQRLDQERYMPPYFTETEINLAMGLMLRDELESRGIGVVMTRETGTAANVYGEDVNGDGRTILDGEQHGDRDELQRRINICNEAGADVLISLHLNGFDDPAARGYEVLYTSSREFGDRNLDLATAIYRAVGAAYNSVGFETQARGTKDDQRDLDAATHEFGSEQHFVLTGPAVNNPDYSIVPSEMPGIFVEPVFVSNQDDANFLVNPDNQRLLVEAYANGIEAYLEQHPD
jgi:N-acetylmuramoyl-L-alanine amidase